MRIEELIHAAMVQLKARQAATPGWVAPDVFVDDLRAWADRGREFGLSRRTIRALRRTAAAIEDRTT